MLITLVSVCHVIVLLTSHKSDFLEKAIARYSQQVQKADPSHYFKVVQILVSIQHPTELLCIFDVERNLQVLLLRSKKTRLE